MADITQYRLNLYDSIDCLPVQIVPEGIKYIAVSPWGNSLLSTVWVKSVDAGASVLVKWFDYGPGPQTFPGERVPLASHPIINISDKSHRLIVSKIHNRAIAEIIVSGGSAEMGIFVTSVSSFTLDAPFADAQIYNAGTDAGNANVLLDESDGKMYLWRGQAGSGNVFITGGSITEEAFNVKILKERTATTPNSEQILINSSVPSNKNWRIRNLKIITRCYGKFVLEANGDIIGEGVTSPAESNVKYEIFPYWPLDENINLKVKFIQNYGQSMDVSCYLQLTENDV